jgi:hypothetical protein
VHAADPVDDQHDLVGLLIDIGGHLVDEGAHDALLQTRICRRRGPDGLEIRCERGERCWVDDWHRHGRTMCRDLALNLRYVRERRVPARLQFATHQPGGKLANGAIRCARRFCAILKRRAMEPIAPSVSTTLLIPGGDSGCDSAGAHNAEKRLLDGVVDTQAAKGDAMRLAIVLPGTAAVSRNAMLCARISKRQLAPAAAAPDHTGQ